jgi:hypothetical protein
MKMKTLLLLAAGLALGSSLSAQVTDAIGQVDNSQQRRALERSAATNLQPGETAAESYEGEQSDVGPQTVIRYPARHNWLQAAGDVTYYRTDNLFLLDDFQQEADVLLSTVEAVITPPRVTLGGGELTTGAGYRHQWYSFGLLGGKVDGADVKLDTFDFNAGTAFADAVWQHGRWTHGIGFDHTRLNGTESGDEFYREYVLRWHTDYTLPLCPKSSLTISYDGDYRWTDPSGYYLLADRINQDRTDHALTALLNFQLCRQALLQPYYRFKFTHFTSRPDRDDYLHTLGLGVYCPINKGLGVRFFAAWETRSVCGSSFAEDYEKFDVGGGLNVTFRF